MDGRSSRRTVSRRIRAVRFRPPLAAPGRPMTRRRSTRDSGRHWRNSDGRLARDSRQESRGKGRAPRPLVVRPSRVHDAPPRGAASVSSGGCVASVALSQLVLPRSPGFGHRRTSTDRVPGAGVGCTRRRQRGGASDKHLATPSAMLRCPQSSAAVSCMRRSAIHATPAAATWRISFKPRRGSRSAISSSTAAGTSTRAVSRRQRAVAT